MRVKWTRQSLTDMEELLDYWEANTPVTREKKLNAVLARTDKLEIFPVMGRIEPRLAVSRPVAELRCTTVGFSKIIYQVDGEIIWTKQMLDSRKLRIEDTP